MQWFVRDISAKVALDRYLGCANEARAEALLERLMQDYVLPLARPVLACKALDLAEKEEAEAFVLFAILTHWRKARQERTPEPVRRFTPYVRWMTQRAFGDLLAQKYPERRRLKNRLRFLVNHTGELACWQSAQGETQFGLAAWQTQKPSSSDSRWHTLRENPCAAAAAAMPQQDTRSIATRPLVFAILRWVGRPVDWEDFITQMAEIQGIVEFQTGATLVSGDTDAIPDAYENIMDTSTNMERDVLNRAFLKRTWEEIGRLKPPQRQALLLGGRDDKGVSLLSLFTLVQVACLRQIAVALEMTPEELAQIWNQIPLPDSRLASLLGISEVYVRVRRSEARKHLQQRLAEE